MRSNGGNSAYCDATAQEKHDVKCHVLLLPSTGQIVHNTERKKIVASCNIKTFP